MRQTVQPTRALPFQAAVSLHEVPKTPLKFASLRCFLSHLRRSGTSEAELGLVFVC